MRILLFLATNIAVLVLVSLIFNLLGVEGILANNGVDLNLSSLLIFCALFGFSGSFISLLLSKWMAKRSTGVQIITSAQSRDEQWLLETVQSLAKEAGIGMPEVGIFPSDASNAFATGWNRNNALVAVSTGLLRRFEQSEARAVLAHEIGHVANGDMITLTLAARCREYLCHVFCAHHRPHRRSRHIQDATGLRFRLFHCHDRGGNYFRHSRQYHRDVVLAL